MSYSDPEDDIEEYNVNPKTIKFIEGIARWTPEQRRQVSQVLGALGQQQTAESSLESARGWRYMWQRTPKVHLLMLAYFVFFGSAAFAGFWTYRIITTYQVLYLSVFAAIMLIPLIVVFYLSYNYVKHIKAIEIEEAQKYDNIENESGKREN